MLEELYAQNDAGDEAEISLTGKRFCFDIVV